MIIMVHPGLGIYDSFFPVYFTVVNQAQGQNFLVMPGEEGPVFVVCISLCMETPYAS